jgi:hypothetical protein
MDRKEAIDWVLAEITRPIRGVGEMTVDLEHEPGPISLRHLKIELGEVKGNRKQAILMTFLGLGVDPRPRSPIRPSCCRLIPETAIPWQTA